MFIKKKKKKKKNPTNGWFYIRPLPKRPSRKKEYLFSLMFSFPLITTCLALPFELSLEIGFLALTSSRSFFRENLIISWLMYNFNNNKTTWEKGKKICDSYMILAYCKAFSGQIRCYDNFHVFQLSCDLIWQIFYWREEEQVFIAKQRDGLDEGLIPIPKVEKGRQNEF